MPAITPPALSAGADTIPIGFDPSRFWGEVAADGQRTRVASLACDEEGRLLLLWIVGYETSVAAALGRLLKGEATGFLPGDGVAWDGPTSLKTAPAPFWMWRGEVQGTRMRQGMLFPHSGSIHQGLMHPPPPPSGARTPEEARRRAELLAANPFAEIDATLAGLAAEPGRPLTAPPRLLLADMGAPAPSPAAFFGHLRVIHAVVLPTLAWLDQLWAAGLAHGLIRPLPALGIAAWAMERDPRCWNALVSRGVRDGSLPAVRPDRRDRAALHLA